MFLGENVLLSCFGVLKLICVCLSLLLKETWKTFCKCRSDCGREALLTLGVFPEVWIQNQ